VILTRRPIASRVRQVAWDGVSLGPWRSELEQAEVVINLAGRSVNCRYNARHRREIMDSRVASTRAIGQAIASCNQPPRLWLQASTATIYNHRYDAGNDEATGVIGIDEHAPDTWKFSYSVAVAWEAAAKQFALPSTRLVLLRTSLVMSPHAGSVFDVLAGLTRYGLGGTVGNGRQYVSWIHHHDFARAVQWIIDHPEIDGPVNLTSPGPLPNAAFMRALRRALHVRIGMPAAEWMIEIGARCMRTESELVLKSRRVVPGKLLASGFRFKYADWNDTVSVLGEESRRGLNKPVATG
jgi:uncharacterized protein (TIGR01777 family)